MRVVLVALSVLACGSAQTAPVSSEECAKVYGQDCGPEIRVTLRYMTFQAPDAGSAIGGTDAGAHDCGPGGSPALQCQCSTCEVSHTLPLAQLEYGVRPRTPNCSWSWETTTAVRIDCEGAAGCGTSGPPAGAENGACIWAPPLLSPP